MRVERRVGLSYEVNLFGYVAYLNRIGALGEMTKVDVLLLAVYLDCHYLHTDEVIHVQRLAHCSCDAYGISVERDIYLLRLDVNELNAC